MTAEHQPLTEAATLSYDALLRREQRRRWRERVAADPARAARLRAQKRRWWRANRSNLTGTFRVAP